MTPFYSIGRHTVVRSVSWLRIKRALFSTKFMYSNSVPKDLTRLTLVPLFRQILIPVCNNVTCIVQVKYVHEGAGIESDSELEEAAEEGIDLYNESETFSFRNILYPISEDPLIKQLNASTSVQDVFNFIKGYKCELDGQLVSQAVIILWDLQKIFYKVNVLNLYQNQVLSSLLNPYDILNNYINEVSGHPDFGMLLHLVSQWNEDMSVDALTATILYLNKMGVDVHHPVMQKLIDRCEYMLESCGPRFPLTALSRFTVAVNSGRGLWRVLVSKMTLPRILTGIGMFFSAGPCWCQYVLNGPDDVILQSGLLGFWPLSFIWCYKIMECFEGWICPHWSSHSNGPHRLGAALLHHT